MAKSEFSDALDEIQRLVSVRLKACGFRKTGRTFNRHTAGSPVRVVNFQMGQFPIGDYVVPGFRESFYGKFTINLGVALPCVRYIERKWEAKKTYQEYDCEIRERLSSLANGGTDTWWEIRPPVEALATELIALMESHGFPFLDKFASYEAVLQEFDTRGELPFINKGRSALVAAMIHHHQGETIAAADAFQKAKAYCTNNLRFIRHVEEVENACRNKNLT